MNEFDKAVLNIELQNETPCGLKHKEFHRAIEYIVQDFGYTGQQLYSVTIPICNECFNYLASPEYILLYCLKCNDNHMLYKPLGRLDYYGKNILWQSCCKECKEDDEKVNIFFTD